MGGKKLSEIIHELPVKGSVGNLDIEIGQIDFDSRNVGPRSLLVAVKGVQTDGHHFIEKALEKGAVGGVRRFGAAPVLPRNTNGAARGCVHVACAGQ